MKILVLLSRVPYPLEKGDKLRAYHFLRLMSQRHEIILIALNEDTLHPNATEHLSQYCKHIYILPIKRWSILWNIGKAFIEKKPMHIGYFWNHNIYFQIQHLIHQHQPDHVFCQLIRMAEYVKHIPIQKTIDYQDAFSKGIERRIKDASFWMRGLFQLEYLRLQQYEANIFPYFDNKIIISHPDRSYINHLLKEKIHVVPNGVDIKTFEPATCTKEFDLVFTGNMNYAPNIKAAELLTQEIIPIIRKTYPNIKLVLAGASPHRKIKALESEYITVTGWVDDIKPYYQKSKIFIAPLTIGTGLQNKLLEAMAMGIPCITSPLANQALHAKANEEILIGHSIKEYTEHIIHLLTDTHLSEKIARNGRRFVEKNYSWDEVGNMIENIICSTHQPK